MAHSQGHSHDVVRFFNAWPSPFAQRVWIALNRKGIDYERIDIDPSYERKPPELLKANPKGTVPTIIHKGHSVYESSIVIEYLEDAWPYLPADRALFPKEPHLKAQARIRINAINTEFVPSFFSLFLAKTQSEVEKGREKFTEQLRNVNDALKESSPEGPFFSGPNLEAVDANLIPFAVRLFILERLRGYKTPSEEELPRFWQWLKAAEKHPAVVPTIHDQQEMLDFYQKYAEKKGALPTGPELLLVPSVIVGQKELGDQSKFLFCMPSFT
ncbi:glutathione S-transferase [Klebsormidium nitens]|uniref:Glutathione S-transferase n=1 Tax=Klebsormidium nitens TaxID=105231 RepID=A0A1Y1I558_KLENI|nr:glutathione S-transferase [Klebsormidium nitens]|eukprot:GAQ86085.1 glutathione S-transferase [Klebsormidium nitens]